FQVRMNATLLLTRLIGKKMTPFLMEALEDPDPRVVANAIESIGLLKDAKSISILLPFLSHANHRIRANAAVALHPFWATRKKVLAVIEELFSSSSVLERSAGIYVIGQLKLHRYEKALLELLESKNPKLVQHACVALARMKNPKFCGPFLELLLGSDEALAVETARRLADIPYVSRLTLFERVPSLSPEKKSLLFKRLDQTPLDFSQEKALVSGWKEIAPINL
ncbi:MAG: HEAT repeat domain-containing protein, partial [Candidatus Binatia bacterium]